MILSTIFTALSAISFAKLWGYRQTVRLKPSDGSEKVIEVNEDTGEVSEKSGLGDESETVDLDMSKLTRSQRKAIESANNTIKDHLKESDLSVAIEDLKGNPIEKPGGGYWNHAQEVKDAYPGLLRAKKRLKVL